MTSAILSHRHVFGLKADVPRNVHFLEDHMVLYPAGHSTVVYDLENKSQRFIHATEGSQGICSLAISSNARYVAVGERGQQGTVTIYDLHTLKKRKILTTTESNCTEYVSICFSSDHRFVLTQGGAPDWTLVLWQWEKAKVISSIKVSNANGLPISQCSFNPADPSVVCVTGSNTFKALRVTDNKFKLMPSLQVPPEMQNRVITCHSWLPGDRVVLGSDNGHLAIYEAGVLLTLVNSGSVSLAEPPEAGRSAPGDSGKPKLGPVGGSPLVLGGLEDPTGKAPGCSEGVTAVVPWINGFIVGRRGGAVQVFQEVEEDPSENGYYEEVRVLSLGNQLRAAEDALASLALSKAEDQLVATSEGGQIYIVALGDSPGTLPLKGVEVQFDHLHAALHGRSLATGRRAITGMDVCVRKPLVATCGADASVRVWNYLKRTTEIHKTFADEAHSVSFHPSGLQLLVGFTDKLRLMNLLMDDIRTLKEIPIKNCRECKFSNGGHLFAAVNGSTIQLFNLYTCECIGTMRGHNGKVCSLFWTQDDSLLISSGMDGAVYQWDLNELKREGEFVKKGCSYTSAICNLEGDAIFAVGSDRTLREIEFPSSTVTKEIESNAVIGQVVLSNSQRMLFAGTATPNQPGCVRSYKFPLTGDYTEYQCLAGPVTKLCISLDDAFVFAVGEDGSFCIMEVREKDGRPLLKRDKDMMARFAEEILVTKSDLEEKNSLVIELKNKVDELTLHNEYQLRLKDMNYNEKIKEVTEKFTQEHEHDKNKYEMLREERNDLEMEYEEKIKGMEEKHRLELLEIETSFQSRIMSEVERYQQLTQEKDAQQSEWKEQQATLVASHEQYVQEVTEDYEAKLEEDNELKEQMLQEQQELLREFNETKRQLEADIDQEIEELKGKYENKLNAEREATLRFKGENGIMKKKFSALQKDIEVQREDIKAMLSKEQDLTAQIKVLEREIQNLKTQIRDRDETIGEKEKRIYDLKKKNQELEKFKFVLDYKIKELKRQIEPRENEISDMKDQIKEMDQELEQYHKSNASLDNMIGELREKLDGMQKTIMRQRQRLSEQSMKMGRFASELEYCVHQIQNPSKLRDAFARLYDMHVPEKVNRDQLDADIQHEYHRQKEYLEKSVDALKKRLNHDMRLHKEDNMRIMHDNMAMIKEIHSYREKIQTVKMQSSLAVAPQSSEQPGVLPTRPPNGPKANPGGGAPRGAKQAARGAAGAESYTPEEMRTLEQQRKEMGKLKQRLAELEQFATNQSRPSSRERLVPLSVNNASSE